MKNKKTALVTGGAGFIGSHICDFLIENKYKVICMDNLITGSLRNIDHITDDDFIFINHNITDEINIPGPVDLIFHFASPASPIDYLQLPIQTLKVGAIGTHNVLGLTKAKRAKMILASTSEVYGDPKIHPQTEEYWGNVNPVGPRGVYDEAKRFAEALVMAYHRQQGLDTHIVRIFNTYGPRMRKNDGRAIPAFISQALKNKEITVFGNGKQTRSFCYISDQINGIFRLINSDYHFPVNIGNPDEMTILELAEKIKEVCNSSSKIVYHELPVDDPMVRRPDISKAEKILNWKPEVNFEEGIEKTIEWFRNN
ncbi:MAG TPA: SDR family oxidoreductase [Actinobacteria bacterium]|mgnify:CR=1 FL=1|nr:SDR family oxidoreductase [Actinomycetota bacterium]